MTWLLPTLLSFQLIYSATFEQQAIEKAKALNLSEDIEWLALGQYHKSILGGHQSRVTSSSFFLDSSLGPRSPRAELTATIRSFFRPVPDTTDLYAGCRFPARKAWLIQKGVFQEADTPSPECKSLNEWIGKGHYRSLSLVFATGYLKNPASYFGHIFLKFNTSPIRSDQNLTNRTVNYGADLRARDNPIVYVIKGLSGGYSGVYSQNDFYTQRYQYADNQLRDLWEFELNLAPDAVKKIAFRLFELFGKTYPYYFFNENCAYYIVRPLEDILGKKLLPHYLPYSLPKHAVESIVNFQLADGDPLVRDIQYIPSRQVVFYSKYTELDVQEKRCFNNLILYRIPDFRNIGYEKLSTKSKKKVLDVLLGYHDYVHAGIDKELDAEEKRRKILLERLNLPAATTGDHVFIKPRSTPPTKVPKTNLLALGTQFSDHSNRLLFRWRPANHDFLSVNSGRAPYSELKVFDIEGYASNHGLGLNRFDLMQVQALNSSATGLPGDGDFAWSVRLGYGQEQIGCQDCGALLANAFYGYAFGNSANLFLPYILIGGQIQSPTRGSGVSIFETKAGLLSNEIGPFGLYSEAGLKFYLDGTRSQGSFVEIEGKLMISRWMDLRVKIGYERKKMVSIMANAYL